MLYLPFELSATIWGYTGAPRKGENFDLGMLSRFSTIQIIASKTKPQPINYGFSGEVKNQHEYIHNLHVTLLRIAMSHLVMTLKNYLPIISFDILMNLNC